jgi:hypothetical protein
MSPLTHSDEELGELFGAIPETEEVYVYKGPENPLL